MHEKSDFFASYFRSTNKTILIKKNEIIHEPFWSTLNCRYILKIKKFIFLVILIILSNCLLVVSELVSRLTHFVLVQELMKLSERNFIFIYFIFKLRAD